MEIRASLIVIAFGFGSFFSGAGAQEPFRPPESGWEVAGFLGGFDDSPEFGPPGPTETYEGEVLQPDHDPFFGGRLGYTFRSGLFLEGSVGTTSPVLNNAPATAENRPVEMDLWSYAGLAGYRVRLHRRIELFGAAGAGATTFRPEGMESETGLTVTYGVGSRVFLNRHLAVRGDVRMYQTPDALDGARSSAGISGSDETLWGWATTAGLSIVFGGRSDEDGDGVRDGRDACPGTPDGVDVDVRGCALDGDGDGVADHRDRCPGTAAGARVDAEGCATDGDRDGVPDGLDDCPDSPAGAAVDDTGCAGDDDGDGVVNGVDACPGTAAGARVNAEGCALDGDGDGVADGLDDCPDTTEGTEVDETGCAVDEPSAGLERAAATVVHFGLDSAELEESEREDLRQLGAALVASPGSRLEIRGHTDSQHTEAYNRRLSRRRAEAVADFLVASFPDLDRERLVIRALGESRPVASNDTEEGRRQNRRVEFVIR